jgi:hypothetical protein
MKERRVYRVRALKRAQIIFNSGNSTIDCVIRNTSEHGARLEVSSPGGIPDTFDLKDKTSGRVRRCRVVWRKPEAIGVEFI